MATGERRQVDPVQSLCGPCHGCYLASARYPSPTSPMKAWQRDVLGALVVALILATLAMVPV